MTLAVSLERLDCGDVRSNRMKKASQIVFVLLVSALMNGCATPYMIDRGRDCADVFTATAGLGAGAKGRVGLLNVGLFCNGDVIGYRGGSPIAVIPGTDIPDFDMTLTVFSLEHFSDNCKMGDRHKSIDSEGILGIAFVADEEGSFLTRETIPYYTQIELAVGLGGTVRLGFNPGELFDFILGWTTVDIFNDDLEWQKRRSNRTIESDLK